MESEKVKDSILSYIMKSLKESELTEQEFMTQVSCSPRMLAYWKKGERGISIDMADKALRVLGKTYILGGSKNVY